MSNLVDSFELNFARKGPCIQSWKISGDPLNQKEKCVCNITYLNFLKIKAINSPYVSYPQEIYSHIRV